MMIILIITAFYALNSYIYYQKQAKPSNKKTFIEQGSPPFRPSSP